MTRTFLVNGPLPSRSMQSRKAASKRSGNRAGGRHVKSGCLTCKIRHVKCDEEKPTCSRCRSTGRVCDGYGTIGKETSTAAAKPVTSQTIIAQRAKPRSKQQILPNPSSALPGSERDRRSFEFYVLELGQDCSMSMRLGSLHQLIYQLSHTDAAIREGVIALGSLGERFLINNVLTLENQQANDCHGYALRQYGSALKHLHRQMMDEPARQAITTLISCFLFTLFEFMQGNESGALAHLQSGLKILRGTGDAAAQSQMASWTERLSKAFWRDARSSTPIEFPLTEFQGVCTCGTPLCEPETPIIENDGGDDDTVPSPPRRKPPSATPPDAATTELLRAFVIMENSAITWLDLDSWETPLLAPLNVQGVDPPRVEHFASIAEAAWALHVQVLQVRNLRRTIINTRFTPSCKHMDPLIKTRRQAILVHLACWKAAMDDLHHRLGSLCSGDILRKVQVMAVHHEMLNIQLGLFWIARPYPREEVLRALEPRFKTIVSLARSILNPPSSSSSPLTSAVGKVSAPTPSSPNVPPFIAASAYNEGTNPDGMFIFYSGLIQPLYITAVKCQNLSVCNEAVRLLLHKPWRESAWDSATMAKIALRKRGGSAPTGGQPDERDFDGEMEGLMDGWG